MGDYQEVRIARRMTRLVQDAGDFNFSVLNAMYFIFMIALIFAGIGMLFDG